MWLIWKFLRQPFLVEREFVDGSFLVAQVQDVYMELPEVVYRQAGNEGVEDIRGDMDSPA